LNDRTSRAVRLNFSARDARSPGTFGAPAAVGVTVLAAIAIVAVGAVVAIAAPRVAAAQKLFKYRDANGVLVYTDREPSANQLYETTNLERAFDKPEVKLSRRDTPEGITLYALNTYYAPVQLLYRITKTENVAASTPREGLQMLPVRGEAKLIDVDRADALAPLTFDYEFQFLPGDPKAQHRPDAPYRLPYAIASSYAVSQAYPDAMTHADPSSTYAVDFVMPIGTNVFAARGGTVIDVASDFHESGVNAAIDGPRANVVRVLHDDGTMSLYGHLNWNSIRVVPGQRVERGEYIADSGNTGFSTGPHLHFVVQRNRGGAIVSSPVEFVGVGGAAITVKSGGRYAAH
jgi:murein DD-endopeptidase MepM/ murein hydrolase activator NlpD